MLMHAESATEIISDYRKKDFSPQSSQRTQRKRRSGSINRVDD